MAKASNQKIRILYLMQIFMEETDEENGIAIGKIIDILSSKGIEAERKTIYDDIETLKKFGLDIDIDRRKGVEYKLLSRSFQLAELKLLVDAVQSSKFITAKKSNELIKKIEALASKYEAARLQRQVFVTNRIKTMNESIYYTVDYINEAINTDVDISFLYFSWNEKKEKVFHNNSQPLTVSPIGLTWDDENYYMIAFDHESKITKHYRVDKMQNIRLTSQRRCLNEHDKSLDMAIYSKKTFGMFGGNEVCVTLLCDNSLAGVMLDRFGVDTIFVPETKEQFKLSVIVHSSPTFLSWLMTFGGKVKVLSPAKVADDLQELAKSVIEQYK